MQGLQAELQAANARLAITQDSVPYRIAEVMNIPSAADNTYLVRFVDGEFSDNAGNVSPSYTPRQQNGKYYVHNLGNGVPGQGTKIPVWQWSGKFWTMIGSSNSGSTPPSAPDTAVVWIEQTTGGPTTGDLQQPTDGCVWPGKKLSARQDDVDWALNYCTGTEAQRWDADSDIWVTDFQLPIRTATIGMMPGRVPMLATRVRDSFAVGGVSRELWAVTPQMTGPYVIQVGIEGSQLAVPDANGLYSCGVATVRAHSYTDVPVLDRTDALWTQFAMVNYAAEMKARKPVRSGLYIAYESWAYRPYGGYGVRFFAFDAGDSVFTEQRGGYGFTLPSSGKTTVDPVSIDGAGDQPGMVYSGANDTLQFNYAGTYRLTTTFSVWGGASTQTVRLAYEKSTNGGSTWSTPTRFTFIVSGNLGVTEGSASATLDELFDLNEGDMIRITAENVTGSREVVFTKVNVIIEKSYVRASGLLV